MRINWEALHPAEKLFVASLLTVIVSAAWMTVVSLEESEIRAELMQKAGVAEISCPQSVSTKTTLKMIVAGQTPPAGCAILYKK